MSIFPDPADVFQHAPDADLYERAPVAARNWISGALDDTHELERERAAAMPVARPVLEPSHRTLLGMIHRRSVAITQGRLRSMTQTAVPAESGIPNYHAGVSQLPSLDEVQAGIPEIQSREDYIEHLNHLSSQGFLQPDPQNPSWLTRTEESYPAASRGLQRTRWNRGNAPTERRARAIVSAGRAYRAMKKSKGQELDPWSEMYFGYSRRRPGFNSDPNALAVNSNLSYWTDKIPLVARQKGAAGEWNEQEPRTIGRRAFEGNPGFRGVKLSMSDAIMRPETLVHGRSLGQRVFRRKNGLEVPQTIQVDGQGLRTPQGEAIPELVQPMHHLAVLNDLYLDDLHHLVNHLVEHPVIDAHPETGHIAWNREKRQLVTDKTREFTDRWFNIMHGNGDTLGNGTFVPGSHISSQFKELADRIENTMIPRQGYTDLGRQALHMMRNVTIDVSPRGVLTNRGNLLGQVHSVWLDRALMDNTADDDLKQTLVTKVPDFLQAPGHSDARDHGRTVARIVDSESRLRADDRREESALETGRSQGRNVLPVGLNLGETNLEYPSSTPTARRNPLMLDDQKPTREEYDSRRRELKKIREKDHPAAVAERNRLSSMGNLGEDSDFPMARDRVSYLEQHMGDLEEFLGAHDRKTLRSRRDTESETPEQSPEVTETGNIMNRLLGQD